MTASSVASSTGFVWNDLFSAHFDTTHSLLQEEEDGYEDISSDDELNDGEEAELVTVSVSNKSFLFVLFIFLLISASVFSHEEQPQSSCFWLRG